jgi:hypothetical protein
MSTLNANFPRPRESDQLDEIEEATSESSVAQFLVYESFPRVIIIQQQQQYPLRMLPPPIDSVMGQGDGGQDFIIRRRRLSYLGNIFRSWQRAVISQATFSFPECLDVQNAVQKTTRNIIHYEHDHLSWRSDYFISARADRKTLVVHLANDGFLYISDKDMESVQLGKPSDRHPTDPDGWAGLKTSRREAAWKELEDFTLFADKWFGSSVEYRKMVLYNSALRRIDICFQAKTLNVSGCSIGLEFSFERDWPVTDESDWWH